MGSSELVYLGDQIRKHLAEIEAYFFGHREVTLCVRHPRDPEQDFLLTSEKELGDVIALLERSKTREAQ